ncbi:MAG: hypothetical protein K0S18_1698 [Anaerocolumna sp.]|nr:hypothetical protein [Anaerocolumna sp.]
MNNLAVTEFKETRVLTTQQLAESYETDSKVISKNFTRNQDRYQEGKHYILLQGEDLKEFKTNRQYDESLLRVNQLYLWTEKGAFLHAKSLNTDKAWEVYDELVESYFKPVNIFAELTTEMQALIDKLENNMVIDYGQQLVLEKLVNNVVVTVLGGKESNAYKEVSKKVFSECNRDLKDHFNVNSRNNIPKLKFEEACVYIRRWQPCTNTRILIDDVNKIRIGRMMAVMMMFLE